MDRVIGVTDLKDTRVPLIIPFAMASALGVAQLFLGSSLLVVIMCVAGITVTFLPLHLYGRDIYSMFAILFSVRYLIVALLFKLLYGQSLDSHLFNPEAAYAWTLLLMAIVTAIVMLARRLDPGRQFFPFPNDRKTLRKLSISCFCVGVVSLVIVGSRAKDDGAASAGPLFVIAASLASLLVLGLVAEACRALEVSGGKRLLSPLLIGMFGVAVLAVVALNQRSFLLDAVIGLALVGFIYKAISLRLIALGVVFVIFFSSFFSPLTLYLRGQRAGATSQFIELATQTTFRMIVDSEFRKIVVDTAKFAQTQNFTEDTAYDYFGDRSNVANRLSFVALLDAVLDGVRTRTLIGTPAVQKNIAGVMPGFLGFQKDGISSGDWLGWQTGLLQPPFTTYLVYGLPMEAYATFGWIGFVLYPFIFLLPVLLLFSRLSSFRLGLPVSIFLFSALQHGIIESTSDGFMNMLMREFIVIFVVIGALHFCLVRKPRQRAPRMIVKAELLGAPRRL